MGQILGLGYSGGDKTSGSSTPQIPPELRAIYGQQADLMSSNLPAFKNLIGQVLGGNRAAIAPFVASGVKPAIAPYVAQGQQAVSQLRRQTPRGGAQDAAVANILQNTGMKIGDVQSQVAQSDVDKQNAMMQGVLQMFSSIFGGFNPQSQIGSSQQTKTSGSLGLPFVNLPIG